MRTKSITDIVNQAERIRMAGSWESLRSQWNSNKYLNLCRKIKQIQNRYIRAIGRYQRDIEGITTEQQLNALSEVENRKYPASVYIK